MLKLCQFESSCHRDQIKARFQRTRSSNAAQLVRGHPQMGSGIPSNFNRISRITQSFAMSPLLCRLSRTNDPRAISRNRLATTFSSSIGRFCSLDHGYEPYVVFGHAIKGQAHTKLGKWAGLGFGRLGAADSSGSRRTGTPSW